MESDCLRHKIASIHDIHSLLKFVFLWIHLFIKIYDLVQLAKVVFIQRVMLEVLYSLHLLIMECLFAFFIKNFGQFLAKLRQFRFEVRRKFEKRSFRLWHSWCMIFSSCSACRTRLVIYQWIEFVVVYCSIFILWWRQ